jgi:hypothetical protein
MCHSDEDDELWNTDPQEYIRIKYGKHRNNYYYYVKQTVGSKIEFNIHV